MKKTKILIAALLALVMVLSLCACAGSKTDTEKPAESADKTEEPAENTDKTEEPAEEEKAEEEKPADDNEFLLGSWFARNVMIGDVEKDPDEVFGGTFMLYFSDDGVCTMSIDQQRALVDWELTDNGVVLKGDSTYEGTFQDDSRTTMILVVQGVDVLMEKYED